MKYIAYTQEEGRLKEVIFSHPAINLFDTEEEAIKALYNNGSVFEYVTILPFTSIH